MSREMREPHRPAHLPDEEYVSEELAQVVARARELIAADLSRLAGNKQNLESLFGDISDTEFKLVQIATDAESDLLDQLSKKKREVEEELLSLRQAEYGV